MWRHLLRALALGGALTGLSGPLAAVSRQPLEGVVGCCTTPLATLSEVPAILTDQGWRLVDPAGLDAAAMTALAAASLSERLGDDTRSADAWRDVRALSYKDANGVRNLAPAGSAPQRRLLAHGGTGSSLALNRTELTTQPAMSCNLAARGDVPGTIPTQAFRHLMDPPPVLSLASALDPMPGRKTSMAVAVFDMPRVADQLGIPFDSHGVVATLLLSQKIP